jgi:hypothetical protein
MPLALHPNPASAPVRRKTDHLVMNGQLEVGRIYKRDTLDKSDSQWLWAINGVPRATPGVMRVAGIAPSLEQAQAELQENWEKWLAWANLQELDTEELGAEGVGAEDLGAEDPGTEGSGDNVSLQPGFVPVASEDIGGKVPLQPEPAPPEDSGGSVPIQPEPAPEASGLPLPELDTAGQERLSETASQPLSTGQSADAGRRGSRRRKKSK